MPRWLWLGAGDGGHNYMACMQRIKRRFHMVNTLVNARVKKHRDALRVAGLRPVQIWVSDTRRPNFAEECRRQSHLAAAADLAGADPQQSMDPALAGMGAWTP
ncbi:antitoxin MazE family protein [Verminephrobacter aporrectodeae]|nr:antitoxin MazE family protein [Verminephrobacter aporrectodeae]